MKICAIIIVEGEIVSFDFNPNINLTNVQASSKPTEGGGGNTGYFRRGKKKEDDDLLQFAKETPADSFEKVELEQDDSEDTFFDLIANFFDFVINFIKKLFKNNK